MLIVTPIASRISTAEIRESGIAIRLMMAVRQSNRNSTRIATTSPRPIHIASERFSSDRSMNVAGRKIVGSISTSFMPGLSSSRAFSTLRVTSSVFPVGCFSTIRSSPMPSSVASAFAALSPDDAVVMTASPIGAGKPIFTSATSPTRIGAPFLMATGIASRSSGRLIGERWRTAIRWFGPSMNPPAATAEASATALVTASTVTPFALSRSGSTSTWNCLSRWPQMATFATPGIAISLGLIVQRARVVRSICERTFDETPILSSRLVDDRGERITGGLATTGSRVASIASRSCTSWRARIRSAPSAKIITTDDRPSTDFDRKVFNPCVPFSAFSSGTLMSASTSSVDSPGASVWISTRGGANSGNTSRGAFLAFSMPTTISTTDRASTSTRSRSDVATSQFIMGCDPTGEDESSADDADGRR